MKVAASVVLLGSSGLLLGVWPSNPTGQYDLNWHTIDGGRGMRSSGGEFELCGTIGQPDASLIPFTGISPSGASMELTGGFWFRAVPGDCNTDGSVNLLDFADFALCVTGPGPAGLQSDCRCFDIDADDDVDLVDFGVFQPQRCINRAEQVLFEAGETPVAAVYLAVRETPRNVQFGSAP